MFHSNDASESATTISQSVVFTCRTRDDRTRGETIALSDAMIGKSVLNRYAFFCIRVLPENSLSFVIAHVDVNLSIRTSWTPITPIAGIMTLSSANIRN